jgi:hypothetical protein
MAPPATAIAIWPTPITIGITGAKSFLDVNAVEA